MNKKKHTSCPIEQLLVLIGGKWKPVILWWLLQSDAPVRFNVLKKKMDGVTQKILAEQLRELERDGIVRREMFREMPVRVEYSLTSFGTKLGPVLRSLDSWARANLTPAKLRSETPSR